MSNTVLLAIDGSLGGERALQFAADRAKISKAKVVVVYVIDWSPYSFNTPEENGERHAQRGKEILKAKSSIVEPSIKMLESNDIECEAVVRHGAPAETLLNLTKDHKASQIIIGRRGQSGLKTLLFGSVVGNLIQTSPIPVVVVP